MTQQTSVIQTLASGLFSRLLTPAVCNRLGYLAVVYLFFLVLISAGYPFAETYLAPIMAFIFPLSPDHSWLKSVAILSGMYWLMALVSLCRTTASES